MIHINKSTTQGDGINWVGNLTYNKKANIVFCKKGFFSKAGANLICLMPWIPIIQETTLIRYVQIIHCQFHF